MIVAKRLAAFGLIGVIAVGTSCGRGGKVTSGGNGSWVGDTDGLVYVCDRRCRWRTTRCFGP